MAVISVSGSGCKFRKSDAPRSGCGRISALAIRSTPWSVIAGLSNSARRRATEGRSRGTGAARDRQACQARAASACRPDPVPPRKGQPLGTGTSPHWPAATSHQASPAATRTLPPPPHTTRPECSSPAAFRSRIHQRRHHHSRVNDDRHLRSSSRAESMLQLGPGSPQPPCEREHPPSSGRRMGTRRSSQARGAGTPASTAQRHVTRSARSCVTFSGLVPRSARSNSTRKRPVQR